MDALGSQITKAVKRDIRESDLAFVRDESTITEEVAEEVMMWVSDACIADKDGIYSKRKHDAIGDPFYIPTDKDLSHKFIRALKLKAQLEQELNSIGKEIVAQLVDSGDLGRHIQSRKKQK